MLWSVYAPLCVDSCNNFFIKGDSKMTFEDEAWDILVDEAHKSGMNAIVLELGNGVCYGSYPELVHPNAWNRERVHAEVARLKELGIALVPLMNFSATHHGWLGEYSRMISTSKYYDVCRDLINEVYELFDKPEYIHIAMDEEDSPIVLRDHQEGVISIRRGELFWHDLIYLCDCVRDTGATPWLWTDPCFDHPEEFRKRVKPDNIMLSPWQYFALKEEHYTVIADSPLYSEYYAQEPFKHMDLKYVEDDPFLVRFREQALPAAESGYALVPCVSTVNGCEYNTDETVEYFKTKAPSECVKGFMTAPWLDTTMENINEIVRGIRLLRDAKEKYYG